MARRKSPYLTDAELRLMEVLWEKKSATVADVAQGASGEAPLAYSSVLTILRILESKGHVRYTKEGRAFLYHPVLERGEACQKAVTHLVRRFFQGSPELLVLNLIESGKISRAELKRLRSRIEEEK